MNAVVILPVKFMPGGKLPDDLNLKGFDEWEYLGDGFVTKTMDQYLKYRLVEE